LTVKPFAVAIESAVSDSGMRRRAAESRANIRQKDGAHAVADTRRILTTETL
jgi:hypothetical protein